MDGKKPGLTMHRLMPREKQGVIEEMSSSRNFVEMVPKLLWHIAMPCPTECLDMLVLWGKLAT